MARFDVFSNPHGAGFLLDVQTDLLSTLKTRAVVPMLPSEDAPPLAKTLNPMFVIQGELVTMTTELIAAIPASHLKDPVENVSEYFAEITNALDFLFQGY